MKIKFTKEVIVLVKYHIPNPYIEKGNGKLTQKIRIYDRTLRGIIQVVGGKYRQEERIGIIKKLDSLGGDVIEVGIPFLSIKEQEDFKVISQLNLNSIISALARAEKEDIKIAYDVGAERIYTFIATSEFHRKNLIKLNKQEVIDKAQNAVRYTKDLGLECEFTIRDAMYTEFDYLCKFVESIEVLGVDIINIPDTIGRTTPGTVYKFIKKLKKYTNIPISVHLHNDFGLATANSLAAIEAGAEQIHTAVLGLSERCGMAPIDEIALALKELYEIDTNINLEYINEISNYISKQYDIPICQTKPVLGRNAFLYEVGPYIHSSDSSVIQYEPYNPSLVNRERYEKEKGF